MKKSIFISIFICIVVFVALVFIFIDSGRDVYGNPYCSRQDEGNHSPGLKIAFRCFWKIADESTIQLGVLIFVFFSAFVFQFITDRKDRYYFLFSFFATIFWFLAWTEIIWSLKIPVTISMGWGEGVNIYEYSDLDRYFLFSPLSLIFRSFDIFLFIFSFVFLGFLFSSQVGASFGKGARRGFNRLVKIFRPLLFCRKK